VHVLRCEKYVLACLNVFIDIVQQVWNFEQQQPNTTYDVTQTATESEIYDVVAHDLEQLLRCHY